MLEDSSTDEEGIPYKEVYVWELTSIERKFPDLINTYLKNEAFFNRESMRNWLITEIAGGLLGYTDCKSLKFISCTNQMYNYLFKIIKPYYEELYDLDKKTFPLEVAETNLLMKENNIVDHQTRIVSVDSWDEYVNIFKNYDGTSVDVFNPMTHLYGHSIPGEVAIENLTYDDHHLSCDIMRKNGCIEKKLAYLCKRIRE